MRPAQSPAIAITAGALAVLFAAWAAPLSAADAGSPVRIAARKTPSDEARPIPKPQNDPVAALAAATARAKAGDYLAGKWHPIHFKPAIDKATDADCLACHAEIGRAKPREASEAGVPAEATMAWYQTLDTWQGPQDDVHVRHLSGAFADKVMKLSCTFCHQGNDPRDESPHLDLAALEKAGSKAPLPFTLRKMVNPSETCLRCHGSFPWKNMELPGPWHEIRADMEPEGTPNGCLTCHETIRTARHRVTYLKAAGIEQAAKESSDVCLGCHGGRAWYRISYPFPRTPWPDMPKDTPVWAKDRPTAPDARFELGTK